MLTEHLIFAGELVEATMEGDTNKAEIINYRLYENANEISILLGSINPYWSYENLWIIFFRHLDLAKTMAMEMINGDYRESIKTYDRYRKPRHINMFGFFIVIISTIHDK